MVERVLTYDDRGVRTVPADRDYPGLTEVRTSDGRTIAAIGLIAFALLLTTLDLTAWQDILAITIFVQRTTPLPAWLVRERARAVTPPMESRP